MAVPLDERASPQLVPAFLAPAAELLVEALPATAGGLPVTLVGSWTPLLLAALEERHPSASWLLVESMPPPALRTLEAPIPRVYGRTLPLPLRPGCSAHMLHALSFDDPTTDGTMLREAARVLVPGGTYAGAFLMQGSFDAFLDVARQVAEQGGLRSALSGVRDASLVLRNWDQLRTHAMRAGLVELEFGQEERGLSFGSAQEFLNDPAIKAVLLRVVAIPDEAERHQWFERVARALDERHAGNHIVARVVTGVLRGRRAA